MRQTTAVLALGSNLGDRFDYLSGAVRALGDRVLVVSGVYETPPWPPAPPPAQPLSQAQPLSPAQPPSPANTAVSGDYLNAVVLAIDALEPSGWLELARSLESSAARVRDPGDRYAPRTLDVDLIAIWGPGGEPLLSEDPELTLPHPRAHLRAFVLRPWVEIQPYASLPGFGLIHELLNSASLADELATLRPRPDLLLPQP